MTGELVVIPVFRVLTIVGTVLTLDADGGSRHILVTDTTLPDPVEVVYRLM